ncbi:hypothetical protein [Brevibacillus choshinensis]|uniref:hypothetical protein n=1 Tax=Brevibacillus choshinensis TaxID=54911 RepID=UPI0038B29B86
MLSIIPELLTMLDHETGQPILNPSCKAGMIVDVVTFSQHLLPGKRKRDYLFWGQNI